MNLFSFLFVPLFCFWDFTYKWDRQYLSFSVCFISFSIIHPRYLRVVTNGKISCFLWLSNIPLCVCVCVCVCVSHLLYPFISWAFYSVPLMYMSLCVCARTILFWWLCSIVVVTLEYGLRLEVSLFHWRCIFSHSLKAFCHIQVMMNSTYTVSFFLLSF